MKILAIDTSTNKFTVALYDNGRICGYQVEAFRRLSSIITVTLERVLKTAGWKYTQIDYVGCGIGPGSFTGMRIGLSAVKGLAWAANIPVVGVSSLDIIARGVPEESSCIIPIVDAKRGLVYCSVYSGKKGRLRRRRAYMLATLDTLRGLAGPHAVFTGDGIAVFGKSLIRDLHSAVFLEKDYWYPQPVQLIRCVLDEIKAGKSMKAADIEPLYLYPKECQIRKS